MTVWSRGQDQRIPLETLKVCYKRYGDFSVGVRWYLHELQLIVIYGSSLRLMMPCLVLVVKNFTAWLTCKWDLPTRTMRWKTIEYWSMTSLVLSYSSGIWAEMMRNWKSFRHCEKIRSDPRVIDKICWKLLSKRNMMSMTMVLVSGGVQQRWQI